MDAVLLDDASGILTPQRTRTLVPALLRAINGRAEFELTSHCATGLGPASLTEGLRQGVRRIFTAGRPVANADSIPATLDMLEAAERLGLATGVDAERVRQVDDYFTWIACAEGKPLGRPVIDDPETYRRYASHQIPGGMMSNMVRQLTDLGLRSRLPEILEEASRVRAELGYPVMITPMSQLVGVQATLNVVEGERYRTIPQELRLYARGEYGRPCAPLDPDVVDRILGPGDTPIDPSASFLDPVVDTMRAEQGPFESDEALLLALFNSRDTLDEFYRKRRRIDRVPTLSSPLRALVGEAGRRRGSAPCTSSSRLICPTPTPRTSCPRSRRVRLATSTSWSATGCAWPSPGRRSPLHDDRARRHQGHRQRRGGGRHRGVLAGDRRRQDPAAQDRAVGTGRERDGTGRRRVGASRGHAFGAGLGRGGRPSPPGWSPSPHR